MLEPVISLISKYTNILAYLNIIPVMWEAENKRMIYQPKKNRIFIWYFELFLTFLHGSVLIVRSALFIWTSSPTIGIVRKIYTLYFTGAFGIGLCFCFTMLSYKMEILVLLNSAISMTKLENGGLSLMGISSSNNSSPNQEPLIKILPFYIYDTLIWIIAFANFFYGGCIHVLHVISTAYNLKFTRNQKESVVLFSPKNYPFRAISIFQQLKIQTILWNECFSKLNMIPVLTIVYFHITITAYATIRLYNSEEFLSFVYYLPFPFLLICGLGPQYFLSTLFGTVHTYFTEFIDSWKRICMKNALFRRKIKSVFPVGINFGNMFVFKKTTVVSVVSISIELM